MAPVNDHDSNMQDLFPDNCPNMYFNGFSIAIGMGDVVIALQLNGKPNIILNASYTVAKTLSEALAELVKDLEDRTATTIMTTNVISKALEK